MSSSFSDSFDRALQKVRQMAQTRGHGYVTLEHVMLAVLEEPTAQELFRKHEISPALLQDELLEHIERYKPQTDGTSQKVEETRSVNRVQTRAQMIFDIPTGIHVLEMLFEERQAHIVKLLQKYGIRRAQVAYFREQLDRSRFGDTAEREHNYPHRQESAMPSFSRKEAAIQRYVLDLNESARKGDIDALVGRGEEMGRIMQTLGRRRKNNVVLVGEAGVGKTALAQGLAWRIVHQNAPAPLLDTTVLSLNMGGLVAGTRFRGDFEERVKNLLHYLRKRQNVVLFIDEIHTLIGAGSASGMVMDAADLLKPLLAGGELRCIGATTYREFRQAFERDAALARRFQRIDVLEPPDEVTYQILDELKCKYEHYHQVHYPDEVVRTMVRLSSKYLHDRRQPDKALDLMDETGSFCRLQRADAAATSVSVEDVESVVAMMARLPQREVSSNHAQVLLDLDQKLKSVIFGQDEAIDQLTQALKMAYADLKPERRPMGAFLFSGPTGVGKTEVCRQLAEFIGVKLLRFDMSEYMERHSVARLIGSPPGYVGHEEGGLLTESVVKHPHAVLLLDEAEKAHPDVMDVLLQVMDYGKLTDGNGREVDFRNLILVLTCNVGAAEFAREHIGFTQQPPDPDVLRAIETTFAPEFRNRLDAIVAFQPLDTDSVLAVIERLISELQESLAARGIELRVNKRARRWLAKQGYDPAMGARPMERILREYIRTPLADAILVGTLDSGGVVKVSANRFGLHFEVEGEPAAVLH